MRHLPNFKEEFYEASTVFGVSMEAIACHL